MKSLILILSLLSSTCFANDEALQFLSPCIKEAASVMSGPEIIRLESGAYIPKSDFTITYVIFTSGMDGYEAKHRLNVKAKYNPKPPQDGSSIDITCELIKAAN